MRPIIYISTFFPKESCDATLNKMNSAANISASAFSYSLLSGLAKAVASHLYVINVPPTGPYPFNYKNIMSHKSYTEEYGVEVESIGGLNLYGVQNFSITANIYRSLLQLNIGDADIIVYSANISLLKAAVLYKDKFKDTHITLVVPDLYEDINNNSWLHKSFKEMFLGSFDKLCTFVDAYVLLTPQMIERMPVKRPFCVVEGIYNPSECRNNGSDTGRFTILYTGMLYEKFGVKNLIDAVCSLTIPNIELVICGSGDLEQYIIRKASVDKRIVFLGVIPRDQVLALQSNASLLVNPRQPNGDFTRYSFPSKNIEYLASGVPTLIYELEGIPIEYYRYCFHLSPEEKNVNDLMNKIIDIYNTPKMFRQNLAEQAQKFIYSKKNSHEQCKKIINLINQI